MKKRRREVQAEGSAYTEGQSNGAGYVWGSVRKSHVVGSRGSL